MFEAIIPGLFGFFSHDSGSNSYILMGKKTALIDSGIGNNVSQWSDFLALHGLMLKDIDFILHSHAHADHFLGDRLFPNAEIFWPELDAKFIEFKDEDFSYMHFFDLKFFPKISRKLKENELIDLGQFQLQVFLTPGHTIGSVCFFDAKNKLLFSGDTLFKGAVGRWDLISGNKFSLLDSIKKLQSFDFDFLLPGHGALVNGNQETNFLKAINLLNSPLPEF